MWNRIFVLLLAFAGTAEAAVQYVIDYDSRMNYYEMDATKMQPLADAVCAVVPEWNVNTGDLSNGNIRLMLNGGHQDF